MKRKTPVRHTVRSHKRLGKLVKSFERGKGRKPQKLSKHRVVKRKINTSKSIETRQEELILSTHKVKPINEIYRLVKDEEALDRVLSQNLLRATKDVEDYTVCFTANPSIRELFIYPWEYEYRLVFDFPRLRKEHQLVPVYYADRRFFASRWPWLQEPGRYIAGVSPPEEVQDYYRKLNIKNVEEYGGVEGNVTIYKWAKYNFESEWFCYHDVPNVKKYLLRVERT